MKQWDTATLPVGYNRAFRQQYARVRARVMGSYFGLRSADLYER
jgi:hypothetical protein